MKHKQKVAGQGGWNAEKECWQFTEVYQEDGFPMDTEWENGCYITRVRKCLWIEVSCYVRKARGELELQERSRECQHCYILAQKYCQDKPYAAWTEDAEKPSPHKQEWDVDGEYWKDIDNP